MVASRLWWTRIRRRFFAASAVGLVMLVPLVAVIANALSKATVSESAPALLERMVSSWIFWGAVFGFLIALAIAVFQTMEKYRRLTYDPTWALKFQEVFDSDQMQRCRSSAARILVEQRQHLSNIEEKEEELSVIDDVLDFIEDIGFYECGDQISPEVAHHHFYHWIRLYHQASRPYIEAWRKKESARWEHISGLLEITSEVETERTGLKREALWLSDQQRDKYLREEMRLEEDAHG